MVTKKPTSYALTPHARDLLRKLAMMNGMTMSAWLEQMIREQAKKHMKENAR